MKIKTDIIEVSHDDLVNLFSTALSGSLYMVAEYDKDFYNSIPIGKINGDCFEDKLADVLLNGGEIYVYDNYSEGEVYNDNGVAITEEYGGETYTQYTLKLNDVIKGLQNAANGSYKTNNDTKYIKSCFYELANEQNCDLDHIDADSLMQVILFNELIYG